LRYPELPWRLSVIRRILLTAILATVTITPVLASSASAGASITSALKPSAMICGDTVECKTVYYYDAAETMVAGWWKDECDSVIVSYGDTNTPYYTTTVTAFCVPGGGGT
jgi:hypothetical protein